MGLAKRGARVILACRDQQRAEAAVNDIKKESGNSEVLYMHLDLASLQSVRSFAENFLKTEPRLDILINNAGLVTRGKTKDGFGMIFGVNHLGHFLLTVLLLDRLKACSPSRVITVSSDGYKMGKIDFDSINTLKDLGRETSSLGLFKLYCHSKLCNILFTRELARKLEGTGVTCYCLHPVRVSSVQVEPSSWCTGDTRMVFYSSQSFCYTGGAIFMVYWRYPDGVLLQCASKTCTNNLSSFELWIHSLTPGAIKTEIGRDSNLWWKMLLLPFIVLFFLDVESGAQTTLHCALQEGIEHLSGRYFSKCAVQNPFAKAKDDAAAKKLWECPSSALVVVQVMEYRNTKLELDDGNMAEACRQFLWEHFISMTSHCSSAAMFHLVLAALAIGVGYVLLVETLFKKSQCKGRREMSGKTVIITGGNTGIGKATAMELAGRGARVILACRNQDKAASAISDIKKATGSSDVAYMQLDLSSLKSVRSFTEIFLKTESRLDLLINNAGLVADGRTEDGFGIEFGVNHLGHFLLTRLLLDRLKESPDGRVITVSSMAHRWGKIDFDALVVNKDLGTGRYSWQFFQAYCNSKLCNVLFTHELAKRLEGTNVTCYSVHPGIVKTELSRNVSLWQKVFIEPVAWLLFLDPKTGAQTTLHCALQEGIEALSGRYFSCCAVQDVSAKAKDDAVAKKLWEVSERLSGLSSKN
ncbi:hypothetical protein NFI96_022796 [Prochilodus magdalenae]|nr:hypothetical protein NFI96_022796 [Prochilodus magdalenae]